VIHPTFIIMSSEKTLDYLEYEVNLLKPFKLSELVTQTKEAISAFGLSQKTLSNYNYEGFAPICCYFAEQNQEDYSKELAEQLVLETRQKYKLGLTYRSKYQNIRRVTALLYECYKTGTVKWSCLPNWKTKQLGTFFSNALSAYVIEKSNSETLSIGSIKTYKSKIIQLLAHLEEKGHSNFLRVTRKEMSDCITVLAKRYPCGLDSALPGLRSFCSFLNEKQWISIDLVPVLQTVTAKRRKIRHGFTHHESEQIRAAINRETSFGKRDYAMLTLAIQTGLRAIDITNLKYGDIDWHIHEIRIIQHKTGHPLTLPLEPDVGNAIADYLLHSRPDSDSPYLFLRSSPPYQKLENRSASGIATKYMKLAEVDRTTIERRGFHSFRRSLGAKMLEAEIPLSLISEVFGHTHMDSAKPYLGIHETQLKECALGLLGIEVAKEEFQ